MKEIKSRVLVGGSMNNCALCGGTGSDKIGVINIQSSPDGKICRKCLGGLVAHAMNGNR